jgi:hypothetical protein
VTDIPSTGHEPKLDSSVPHNARVWNYWLGGKDHFESDRTIGDQIREFFPDIVTIARESRKFHIRAVTFLAAEAGIRQFLDIGTGLPTANNTHEVAQSIAPTSRIVYVDNDPLVLVHARALLTSSAEGVTDYIEADVRDPGKILEEAVQTLDLSEPVGLMMLGILGNVVDYDQARSIVDQFIAAVPAGSYLVINDGTNVINPDGRNAATQTSIDIGTPYISRSPQQIAGYFEGLELIEPGVVSSPRWRPDIAGGMDLPAEVDVFCGVARRP